MLVPGAFDRREFPLVDRFEIDASHLGAKRGAGRNDVNRTGYGLARNFAFDIHVVRPPGTIDRFRLSCSQDN
jgi:hypothetical protein